LDVWNYIQLNNIELPNIYFSHPREVINIDGHFLAMNEFVKTDSNDVIENRNVRYRTVGDMTCTAAVLSEASTIQDVIYEIMETRVSERGETRIDDRTSEAAMEDRKKNGYF
jgi:sulfate adenylyltransferase subunit 2